MDEISFKNAPIVELVAELRWTPGLVFQPAFNQVAPGYWHVIEKFYSEFGSRVAQLGYTQSERLIPVGFAVSQNSIVCRYRKPGDNSSLIQIGPGIFSANALRPYKRWSAFKGTVASAVEALLETRLDAERHSEFNGTSLRYINAFAEPLLSGKQPAQFIADVLKFDFSLPPAFSALADKNKPATTTANILIPIANTTKVMALGVGEGLMDAAMAVLLDINVGETRPIASSAEAVMEALNASRDVIHRCFLDISTPIHAIMKPESNDAGE